MGSLVAEPEVGFKPGPWEIGNEAYHEDRLCVSHSALEVFRRSIPLYHGRYVTSEIERAAPTKAMRFGSAFEAFLLEPHRTEEVYAVCPEIDRRTKAGKADWAAFEAQANGRLMIDNQDLELMRAMRDGLARSKAAQFFVTMAGEVQYAARWQCPDSGVACKLKIDKLFEEGLAIDLKTTDDPSPEAFRRTVINFGYARQAAMYIDGTKHALGIKKLQFLFLVVGKEPPHEAIVYELDQAAIGLGREQNREDLLRLAECRRTGNWLGRWSGDVVPLKLPHWAFNVE